MQENKKYQICSKCVMDTSDPDISFNEEGTCIYCIEAKEQLPKYRYKEQFPDLFYSIGDKIKNSKKKGKYDSIIGLSGGVDSSYVAYLAVKKLGLNPIAIHFDNGWNTDIAISNIEKVVKKLNLDLETYVIDWEEFKSLQRAFIKASVVDIELLTDHAHKGATYRIASKYGIRYNLTGGNYVTEHGMPKTWYWPIKQDLRNIRSIGKKFENIRLKRYPTMGLLKYNIVHKFKLGYENVPLLNYINFRRFEAIRILEDELDWRNYGGKHAESFFTKFYQQYILPVKFNIDKRRVHFSALIRNNEISRKEAIELVSTSAYKDEELRNDIDYFLKKLDFTENEFKELMHHERIPHEYYGTDLNLMNRLRWILLK